MKGHLNKSAVFAALGFQDSKSIKFLSVHASGLCPWPTKAPSFQCLLTLGSPSEDRVEDSTGLGLSSDGQVPRNGNGVRFQSQAVDHCRVLPCTQLSQESYPAGRAKDI